MSTALARRYATVADLLAIPEKQRFHEILGGELVQKALPSGPHGRAQRVLGGRIGEPYDRKGGGGRTGGWWIVTEVEAQLGEHEIVRPDISGWLRTRLPKLPCEAPIPMRPDWACEVLSRSNASNDLVKKMRVYHRAGIPHYWIVDPDNGVLTVYRWAPEGYVVAISAERGERVRAEPFGEIELEVAGLFAEPEEDE